MGPRAQEFWRIAPRPDGADDAPPGGAPGGGPRPGRNFPGGMDRNAEFVTVALELPGGRKALAETLVFQPSLQIPAEAWVSLLLLFAVTAIFSIWAVRLATQPVRMLAGAAERLSRNIDEPPLPEKGAAEIRAATRAFNRMQDRLRRHVNSRALAFAAMSHDIRTPLTRMRLRLESLAPEARARIEDDVAEIESIARSVLEVARELSSDEPMTRVDLPGLVRRLLEDYEQLGSRITVTGSCAPVIARPAALRRALANLIENGIKYGEEVAIELDDSADHAVIRVCDRGPGIPEEHLDKVVHPFYRVESSRNRDTGGSGLGLAITKDIVEGQGGELLLENRATGGLCATIRLPR
jgi:signal transduction histidine kinase